MHRKSTFTKRRSYKQTCISHIHSNIALVNAGPSWVGVWERERFVLFLECMMHAGIFKVPASACRLC